MNDVSVYKYRKFVELLYKKTAAREISWQVGNANSIHADISSNKVIVRTGNNNNGEDLVIFELLNSNGDRADIFNDESLPNGRDTPDQFESWFNLCQAIYELGMRHATGADDVLDAMIDELDDEVPF